MALLFTGVTGIIGAVISIIFGIMILVWPKMLRLGLVLYFIIIGVLELIGQTSGL